MRISFHQWLSDIYWDMNHSGFGSNSLSKILYIRPRIFCVDGFNISVQGSTEFYSEPRDVVESYSSMECGFPSKEEDLLKNYAESNDYLNSVYPYTPVEVIEQVVEKHGGIDPMKTFQGKKDFYKHYLRQSKLERILL